MREFKYDKKLIWLVTKYMVNLFGLMYSIDKAMELFHTRDSILIIIATMAFAFHLGYTCNQLDKK